MSAAPSPTGKKKPAVKLSVFGTVFAKCTLLIAVVTATLVGVMTFQMSKLKNEIAIDGAKVLAEKITTVTAMQTGNAFRFDSQSDIQRILEETLESSHHYAAYAIATDIDGMIIAQTGTASTKMQADILMIAQTSLMTETFETTNDGLYAATPVWFGSMNPSILGSIAIAWSAETAITEANINTRHALMVTGLFSILILISSGFLLRLYISRPLNRVNAAVKALEDDELNFKIPSQNRSDEIGQIAKRLASLQTSLLAAQLSNEDRKKAQIEQSNVVETLSDGLQRLANGDLSMPLDTSFTQDYEPLRHNYNATIQKLKSNIGSVITNARSIKLSADEISQSSYDLANRTETQAATLEQTAAALDEISASVSAAAKDSKEVETIVEKATRTAQGGSQVVRSAVDAMAEIESSSDQISQIISVIDDIAFQTNLLALNAGVEAARAGEAGRGFAVVASEVRALAQRSSDAAREIKSLIQDSSRQVSQGVGLVDKAGDELTKIVASVTNISTLMSNIASSASEQSYSIKEINIGVNQLDQVTQQNSAMVQQVTAASFNLKTQAQTLEEEINNFRIEADTTDLFVEDPSSDDPSDYDTSVGPDPAHDHPLQQDFG